jgi:hypothetical protein
MTYQLAERYYVGAFRPMISAAAAVRGAPAFTNAPHSEAVLFENLDSDLPTANLANITAGELPTPFDTEDAAHEAVKRFLTIYRAHRRIAERTGRHTDHYFGSAADFLDERTFHGSDAKRGGHEVLPYSGILIEAEAEARLYRDRHDEAVAAAQAKADEGRRLVDEAQAQPVPDPAAAIREAMARGVESDRVLGPEDDAELLALERKPTAATYEAVQQWHRHADLVGVQQRRVADGSFKYRARVKGITSPSFKTAEEADAWREKLSTPPDLADAMFKTGSGAVR